MRRILINLVAMAIIATGATSLLAAQPRGLTVHPLGCCEANGCSVCCGSGRPICGNSACSCEPQ